MTPATQQNAVLATLSPREAEHVAKIIAAVSELTGVSDMALRGAIRSDRVAKARHLAMALIRSTTSLSLMEIGDLFCRDHGTVMHAIKRVRNRAECEPEFAADLRELGEKIDRPS